jgi:hypothetical protein
MTNDEAMSYAVVALYRAMKLGLVSPRGNESDVCSLFAGEVLATMDEYTEFEAVQRARALWEG